MNLKPMSNTSGAEEYFRQMKEYEEKIAAYEKFKPVPPLMPHMEIQLDDYRKLDFLSFGVSDGGLCKIEYLFNGMPNACHEFPPEIALRLSQFLQETFGRKERENETNAL